MSEVAVNKNSKVKSFYPKSGKEFTEYCDCIAPEYRFVLEEYLDQYPNHLYNPYSKTIIYYDKNLGGLNDSSSM